MWPFKKSRAEKKTKARSPLRLRLKEFGVKKEGRAAPSQATCPGCGRAVGTKPCWACTRLGAATPLVSRRRCTVCQGRGFTVECPSCKSRQQEMERLAQSKWEQEALARNPFLPYYDKRFRKYRK